MDIQELYERAVENYKDTRSDYDAGICEGIKRSMELIKGDNEK